MGGGTPIEIRSIEALVEEHQTPYANDILEIMEGGRDDKDNIKWGDLGRF